MAGGFACEAVPGRDKGGASMKCKIKTCRNTAAAGTDICQGCLAWLRFLKTEDKRRYIRNRKNRTTKFRLARRAMTSSSGAAAREIKVEMPVP